MDHRNRPVAKHAQKIHSKSANRSFFSNPQNLGNFSNATPSLQPVEIQLSRQTEFPFCTIQRFRSKPHPHICRAIRCFEPNKVALMHFRRPLHRTPSEIQRFTVSRDAAHLPCSCFRHFCFILEVWTRLEARKRHVPATLGAIVQLIQANTSASQNPRSNGQIFQPTHCPPRSTQRTKFLTSDFTKLLASSKNRKRLEAAVDPRPPRSHAS
jgi:hypothetical protein